MYTYIFFIICLIKPLVLLLLISDASSKEAFSAVCLIRPKVQNPDICYVEQPSHVQMCVSFAWLIS